MAVQPDAVFFLVDRANDMGMEIAARCRVDAKVAVFETFAHTIGDERAVCSMDDR